MFCDLAVTPFAVRNAKPLEKCVVNRLGELLAHGLRAIRPPVRMLPFWFGGPITLRHLIQIEPGPFGGDQIAAIGIFSIRDAKQRHPAVAVGVEDAEIARPQAIDPVLIPVQQLLQRLVRRRIVLEDLDLIEDLQSALFWQRAQLILKCWLVDDLEHHANT